MRRDSRCGGIRGAAGFAVRRDSRCQRLYLLGQDDQPTGTYTFAELLVEELAAADRI